MSINLKKPTPEQCKDSGLALTLICLLCYLAWQRQPLVLAAVFFLLLTMTCPRIFKPFAFLWFALSASLGAVASRAILTFVYFVLVVPVGLIRRLLGKDSLQMNKWHKGKDSVFRRREHSYTARDLDHPY